MRRTPIELGEWVGDYQLIRHLGSGGMGTLYVARRRGASSFSRDFALKLIHPHLLDDVDARKHFIDEAKIASRIRHPNVVPVLDLGGREGLCFLVMEYVEGLSLRSMLLALRRMQRPVPIEVSVWIAAQIADGLHAAHETRGYSGEDLGIVHRDVSPSNVLVAHTGHASIIDFGVAKATLALATHSGRLVGKLGYMAPEQARGERVDRRADIYALGVVLWEMLTSRRLFVGDDDLELLNRVRAPEIISPKILRMDISSELEAITLSALSANREERTATAGELRESLLACVPDAARLGPERTRGLLAAIVDEKTETRSIPSRPADSGLGQKQPLALYREHQPTSTSSVDLKPTRSVQPPRGRSWIWFAAGAGAAVALLIPFLWSLQLATPSRPGSKGSDERVGASVGPQTSESMSISGTPSPSPSSFSSTVAIPRVSASAVSATGPAEANTSNPSPSFTKGRRDPKLVPRTRKVRKDSSSSKEARFEGTLIVTEPPP